MNAAEALDRAADNIVQFGWWDGKFSDGMCAYVAICEVRDNEAATEAIRVLSEALCGRRIISLDAVATWNDTPGRTKDEVIAMLRSVAMVERARAHVLPAYPRQIERTRETAEQMA
jgi:hypothetical protein